MSIGSTGISDVSGAFLAWVAVAFFAAICWGAVVVLNKRVLDYVHPLSVNIAVLATSTACLVLVMVPLSALELWPLGFEITWKAAGYIAAGSVVTWVVAFNAYYVALRSGKIGVVGPITGTDPLFTALFAVVIVGAVLGPATLVGLVIATVGVVLVSRWSGDEPEPHAPVLDGTRPSLASEPAFLVVVLSLVTAAGWGFSPIMIQLAEQDLGGTSASMILLGDAFGLLLLVPFAVLRRVPVFIEGLAAPVRRNAIVLLLVCGALNAFFAVLFYLLIEHIGAVLTVVIVATSPLWAILGGALFLGERLRLKLAIGGGVTILGVCVAVLEGAS